MRIRAVCHSDGSAAMNDMYNDLTKVIIELEKSLSVKKNA